APAHHPHGRSYHPACGPSLVGPRRGESVSTSLYMETQGQGPELLLLHGWGLHGGIWDTLVPKLAPHLRITRVDLPGHGRSRDVPMPHSLTELALQIMAAVPPGA